MSYFKHSELAREYHVALKTVYNWIESAKQRKLDLELVESKDRIHIADTEHNLIVLQQLAQEGKKYRNSRFQKVVTPKPEFYELFSRQQILDIITNLNVHREIPLKYNYFDNGATNWDTFATRRLKEDTPNLLNATIELIHANLGTLDLLLQGHDRINVIDVGPGNGLPVRELLEHLLDQGILHRYIAVDISENMLRIAEENIKEWFGGKVKFEGYVKDITYERFDDLLVDDMLNNNAGRTINLALVFGATPMNFQSPYDSMKVIGKSLSYNDLLLYADKPDTEAERRSFGVNEEPGSESQSLSSKYSYIFDLLAIDGSLYDVELGYDVQRRVRYIRVRLKTALSIQFKFQNGEQNVNLDKGDTILLWRVWHQTTLEIIAGFEEAGFSLLQASLTKDRSYLLTASGIFADPDAGAQSS